MNQPPRASLRRRHHRRRRGPQQEVPPILSATEKEEARVAVLWAAEQRWKAAAAQQPYGWHDTASLHDSLEASQSSSSPKNGWVEKPSERAVWRGSRRGRHEVNETTTLSRTTTTTTNSTTNQRRQRQSPIWKRMILHPSKGRFHAVVDSVVDAWMCGVCGKAFTTLEAADIHEQAHVHQVVSHLPWLPLPPIMTHRPVAGILRRHYSMGDLLEVDEREKQQSPNKTPVHSNRRISPWEEEEEAKLPDDELPLPHPRKRTVSYDAVPLRIDPLLGQPEPHEALILSETTMAQALLADEALVQVVVEKATPLILSAAEQDAEFELDCLAMDKQYYDALAAREVARRIKPSDKYRSNETDWLGKIQNKFVDAYQLMKQGADKKGFKDEYIRTKEGGNNAAMMIQHTHETLYLNVMVKNNIRVVRKELERLAYQRWERAEEMRHAKRFERFRAMAHVNMVRIAGLALANDFTPRRVAVQLSNDLHRLLTPRLRRRGVTIETGIEYRVGPYFVIGVNITQLDWAKLIKATHKEVAQRKQKWHEEEENHDNSGKDDKNESPTFQEYLYQWPVIRHCVECFVQMRRLTQYEVLAQLLAWCYHLHWVIYQPLWLGLYYTFLGHAIRQFILSSAADEIFYYIEQKGMEMEIDIRHASTQAAFMLSALCEIRAGGQELAKKRQQTESKEKGNIVGPMLGPAIKADKENAEIPEGFELPANLEYLGLELELPVGFRRLRWALLHKDSKFVSEVIYRTEAKYDNITMGVWNKHADCIGLPVLPPDVDQSEFIGAEREASYLMPKSAFVKANMCSETQFILAYNDYCFCVRKKALTPEAPFGSTFVAWTQLLVINTGNDSCKLYCSVEPEFPNGPPLVSRQITSGMRAGVSELFVLIGETIVKYADEFP